MKQSGSKFTVDFGEVTLPKDVAAKLDREIRRAAMHSLAGIDLHGDAEITFRFPRDWAGLIARFNDQALKQFQDQPRPG